MPRRWLEFALLLRIAGIILVLLAQAMPGLAAEESPDSTPPPVAKPKDTEEVWPYQLIDYAQVAHEYRIMNSPVIVLGQIESIHTIDYTKKDRKVAAWLRVETFLRTDRPGQPDEKKLLFRFNYLRESFKKPIEVGDRCLLLLERDLRYDDALVLPTDMDYYPITPEGNVQKFMKIQPTLEDPVLNEVSVTVFLDEIRRLLNRVSLEEQARTCDLVMTGVVVESKQGVGDASDYFYVRFKPDRVFKGQLDGELVTFIQRASYSRWTIPSLNRAAYRAGDRALCFGNKDPTYSGPGSWNPKGEVLYIFPFERLSTLFLASETAWRRGVQPIPLEQLYADLARWTGSKGAGEP